MYVEPIAQFNSVGASKFSIGVVLSRSFSTLVKHPFVFMGLAFLAQLPTPITMLLMLHDVLEFWPALIIGATLSMFMLMLIQGATIIGVYEVLRGNTAQFGKSLTHMIRILPKTLGVLLAAIFITTMVVPSALLYVEYISANVVVHILANIMMLIAMWLVLRWCVIIPVCIAERLGPIEAIRRAAELTKGCLCKIACFYLMLAAVAVLFNGGVGFALTIFMDELNVMIYSNLFRSIPAALSNVTIAVVYYELRRVKEGISVDNLSNVFD